MQGSIWRKFDLHFHTPTSFDYANGSIDNQKIVDCLLKAGVEVVAITDHHHIDTKRVKELQSLSKGSITFLPGIEFRSELGGKEAIHFIGIFSENSNLDEIWMELQTRCSLKPSDITAKGHDKIVCDFEETCALIHKLGGIVTVHAGGKSNSIEEIKNNHEYKKALKVELVREHIDVFELGGESDQDEFNKIIFPTIKLQRPMIICSDNHNVEEYKTKQNLWIKADPTFDGLKQILFEPNCRIHIGQNPPINPPIRLNKVTLDFPVDAKLGEEIFCLNGKRDIELSPNFTCFIGGRGTGKSTILNLIHEKLKPGSNIFFRGNKIRNNAGSTISISTAVTIDDDKEEKFVEFLSQNEVEDFALNYQKLTDAIYSRLLKKDSKGEIKLLEVELSTLADSYRKHIINKRVLETNRQELLQKEKELATYQQIITSYSSPEYQKLNEEIGELTDAQNSVLGSAKYYSESISDIEKIIKIYDSWEPIAKTPNSYLTEYKRVIDELKKIKTESDKVDFTTGESQKKDIALKIETKKGELIQYLSDRGLTDDNLNDISGATVLIGQMSAEIEGLKEKIKNLEKSISEFNNNAIRDVAKKYQELIQTHLSAISKVLENPSIKPIKLVLDFDNARAEDAIIEEFKLLFESKINKSNFKSEAYLRDVLFCVDIHNIDERVIFLDKVKSLPTTSAAKPFILELFNEELYFQLYKDLCEKITNDYSKYKKINVQYDKRSLGRSSFGQRCTAVLVILLTLGNNPIIIDEPEAHLDSHLIANYLVDVIKKAKQNRQIIFATHNANFVINGDAELIHILETEESGISKITSTTIENPSTRSILIALEGGKEAFIKRENKYQMQTI